MNQVVITRMLYATDNPAFEERLAIYRALCLPRLRRQKNKNFDIAVLCNREHKKVFEDLGVIPFFRKDNWLGQKPKKFWSCFSKWEELEGLDKYDIQTNLDSDDLVSDMFIDKIQRTIEDEINNGHKGSLHIHFQPRLFSFHDLVEKPQKRQYSDSSGSAFYSIYQPDKERYISLIEDSHTRIQAYMDKSVLIGEDYCWIGIHDNNDSTTINS